MTGVTRLEHLENLCRVLSKLKETGLTLKKEKCEFLKNSVHYLGHIIDSQGLHKDPKKVRALVEMPLPKVLTSRKDFKFEWNSEVDLAFKKVKELMLADAMLAHYDPSLELKLNFNASKDSIGCVLLQIDGSIERPIAFASRLLTRAAENYSMLDKEALGTYFGVKRFSQYLLGRKFILGCDNKPLTSIF